MDLMSVDSNTYVVDDVSTTSKYIKLTDEDKDTDSIVIDNTLGSTSVFVLTDKTVKTLVFPDQSAGAVKGKIIGPGCKESYSKENTHDYVMFIRAEGSADVVISVGYGG